MDYSIEKECSALGGLFQSIINDLKGAHPIWDDFIQKASKLHVQLKTTIAAVNIFLDALQKIADMATGAKGATRDLGTALTRICMRHRSIENRLKTLCSALIDCLVQPLSNKIDEWHKTALQMDKDHSKEYNKCRHEIRKRSSDMGKLQKKLRRGQTTVQRMVDSASQEVNDRQMGLLDTERAAVKQALIEQRSQFCMFVSWFKPVMDGETALLTEIGQMSEVMEVLAKQSCDPFTLPPASEAVIHDAKGLLSDAMAWRFKTPPSSPSGAPSSMGSRKSSFCSLSSQDSQQFYDAARQSSLIVAQQKPQASARYSSLSSKDSGFTSQDTLFRRPKSPRSSAIVVEYVQPPRFNSDEEDEPTTTLQSLAIAVASADTSDDATSQQSTPSPSPSSATWPAVATGGAGSDAAVATPDSVTPCFSGNAPPRPHTISAVGSGAAGVYKRQPLGVMTFVPPRPTTLFEHDLERQATVRSKNKPVRSNYQATPTTQNRDCYVDVKLINNRSQQAASNFNKPVPNQVIAQPIYANTAQLNYSNNLTISHDQNSDTLLVQCSQNSNHSRQQIQKRPLSFVGNCSDDFVALAASYCNSSNSTVTINGEDTVVNPGRDDDEDTVTSDCTDQFDKFVSELDHYCNIGESLDQIGPMMNAEIKKKHVTTLQQQEYCISGGERCSCIQLCSSTTCTSIYPAYCTLPRSPTVSSGTGNQLPGNILKPIGGYRPTTMDTNTIVRRPANGRPPPPPPVRRNSAITAATPNAPAVDVVRTGNSRCTTPVDGRSAMYNTVETPLYQHVPLFGHQYHNVQNNSIPPSGSKFGNSVKNFTTTTPMAQHGVLDQQQLLMIPCTSASTTQQIKGSVRIRTAGCRNRSLPRV